MFGISGNEIRFADEILPGGQDEIGTLCRRNPLQRSGRGILSIFAENRYRIFPPAVSGRRAYSLLNLRVVDFNQNV